MGSIIRSLKKKKANQLAWNVSHFFNSYIVCAAEICQLDPSRGETTLVCLVCIWNNIFLALEYLFVITPLLCLCSAWK